MWQTCYIKPIAIYLIYFLILILKIPGNFDNSEKSRIWLYPKH